MFRTRSSSTVEAVVAIPVPAEVAESVDLFISNEPLPPPFVSAASISALPSNQKSVPVLGTLTGEKAPAFGNIDSVHIILVKYALLLAEVVYFN